MILDVALGILLAVVLLVLLAVTMIHVSKHGDLLIGLAGLLLLVGLPSALGVHLISTRNYWGLVQWGIIACVAAGLLGLSRIAKRRKERNEERRATAERAREQRESELVHLRALGEWRQENIAADTFPLARLR